jgi:hypothetical protein
LRFTRNRCPLYILDDIDHFTTPSSLMGAVIPSLPWMDPQQNLAHQ